MPDNKSLETFYAHKFAATPPLPPAGAGDFNVFRLAESNGGAPYARYDFYKIMFIRGEHRCHYADKSIAIRGNTLLFFNPVVPYRFERLDEDTTGFFCLFRESFYTESMRNGIHDLPMFKRTGQPVYALNEKQEQEVVALFEKMLEEVQSSYRFRYDLLRNLVSELIHLALKMEPDEQLYDHPDANARITALFLDMLERQFPVTAIGQSPGLRTAGDFAGKMAVHVNHLNRAVRLSTGKTTTAHIAERIAAEATALLKHTDWNISEISDSLGFAQPAHFSYFFKKQTGLTPSAIRFV